MVYLYALIAGSCDLLSGWFALRVPGDKVQPRYVIAFAAGVVIASVPAGMAFLLLVRRDVPGA